MRTRGASPTRSENEFDIGASLFANDSNAFSDSEHLNENPDGRTKNPRPDVNLDVLGEDSDDDEAIIARQQAASNRKTGNLKGRTVKKGGGFQAMGLNANLLKAITRKGYSVPTPIQRKTIPLLLNEKDVVGMARTGSGKTAAFIIPMIERLKVHSTQVGGRAVILSPSRELALQTLQVVKELGKGTDLRSILLVGGDSLEEQFSAMSSNPDIIIATPGRFVHLKVEMGLDLSSVRYVVFDEADRLFEMGFAAQLTEIIHALPASRQTLLFSATLPKSLVEFARAGLRDPILVRLDADSKISPDLQSAFFTVKSSEKEGALLHILQDVIGMPTSSQLETAHPSRPDVQKGKKRKRSEAEDQDKKELSNPYSTIVFAATKHHVEYLAQLLRKAGYAVSHVYGSLDQTARKMQVQAFRSHQTNILVVTDVAARGIDIPVLANVINYDFPSQPKIYVHRVGRTARAGQKGWSYSLVHDADAPYLLDLQLFLAKKIVVGRAKKNSVNFAEDVVVGGLQRDPIHTTCEWVNNCLEEDVDIYSLRGVATKGEKLYQRTRNSASAESAKRAKSLVASSSWSELHPLVEDQGDDMEAEREKMLARIGGFRPDESIFEIGARRGGRKGNEEAIAAMRKIRTGLEGKKQKSIVKQDVQHKLSSSAVSEGQAADNTSDVENHTNDDDVEAFANFDAPNAAAIMDEASDSELEVTFSNHNTSTKKTRSDRRHGRSKTIDVDADTDTDTDVAAADPTAAFRDSENFMSYTPANLNLAEDRAYGVHSGTNSNRGAGSAAGSANFTEAARGVTMDLAQDDGGKGFGENKQIVRWDKRHKKYVRTVNDDDGSKGTRLVRGESGAKIAASFRSGRFDAWKKANKIRRVPRVGEAENSNTQPDSGGVGGNGLMGSRFKHKKLQTAKAPDRYRDDFEKKNKKLREARDAAREMGMNGKSGNQNGRGGGGGARGGRGGREGKVTNSIDDIRKQRQLKDKRQEKNARPSKKTRR